MSNYSQQVSMKEALVSDLFIMPHQISLTPFIKLENQSSISRHAFYRLELDTMATHLRFYLLSAHFELVYYYVLRLTNWYFAQY